MAAAASVPERSRIRWKPELARFFAAFTAFDEYLASEAPLLGPAEQLFSGEVAG